MKIIFSVTSLFFVLIYRPILAGDPVGPVRAFIQTNLVGLPVLHAEQTWVFDPDVSLRRRRQFIGLHGDKSEKLIERLGLGIDGYEEERLEKQRQRDEGHLGLHVLASDSVTEVLRDHSGFRHRQLNSLSRL